MGGIGLGRIVHGFIEDEGRLRLGMIGLSYIDRTRSQLRLRSRRVGPRQVSEAVHAEVARLDHLGLAPVILPVPQELPLEPDGLRHGDLVLLPGAAEEHGAHVLPGHDGELDPQRVADRGGLEKVDTGTNGQPLYRPEKKICTRFSYMHLFLRVMNNKRDTVFLSPLRRENTVLGLMLMCNICLYARFFCIPLYI